MSNRSVDEIRVDMAANRAKMASAAGAAVEAMKPANIARESVEQVKQFAKTEFDAAASQFKDDEGGWRTQRLLAIGGAVLGLIAFAVTVNAISKHRVAVTHQKRLAITR